MMLSKLHILLYVNDTVMFAAVHYRFNAGLVFSVGGWFFSVGWALITDSRHSFLPVLA